MSHSNTEFLIDYWQERILGGQAPRRSAIDPMHFPALLPQVFILGRAGPGRYPFRLAGGLLRDLHGRDLRGIEFASLWSPLDQPAVQTLLERARRGVEPLGLRTQAHAGEHSASLLVTLLPLSDDAGVVSRFLGLYEALSPLARLRGRPVEELELRRRETAPAAEPFIRLAAVGGRRVG